MKLFSLQWKETFRAPQWEAKLSIRILIIAFTIYFLGSIVLGSSFVYPLLNETVLEKEPIEVFNHSLLFLFFVELILRFFLQQLPGTNIQSLILLPIKKAKIINHVLLRSVFSAFNLFPFIVYLPFAISTYKDDYMASQVVAWWLALASTTLAMNFFNYLINKNNYYFVLLLSVIASTIVLKSYTSINLGSFVGVAFDAVVETPLVFFGFLLLLLTAYTLVFFYLKKGFYLDAGLGNKQTKVRGGTLTMLNFLGEDALFLKNDLRMIIRNARPRQISLLAFFFLFYGLLFFTQDLYSNNDFMLIFASLIITGGFMMSFGNYVPAWDSSYYKLLMTQDIAYKKYILSKWNLMTFAIVVSLVLALPYLYFGTKIYGLIVVTALFNIGLGTWVTLFGGLLNKTPVKLNVKAKAFENTQAFSFTQLVLALPKLVLPALLYWFPATFISPLAGLISLGGFGILGILFKDKIADKATHLYHQQKHETIEAFNT